MARFHRGDGLNGSDPCGRKTGLSERSIWRAMIAGSCGAFKLFVNVARILSDAFWFSAVP
jgi:hypothetical protein